MQNNFIHKRKSSTGQDILKCYKQKRRISLFRGCHSPWQSDNMAIQCEVCIQLNWKGKGKNVKYDSHHQISPGVVCSDPPAHHNLSQKVETSKKPVHLYEAASHYIERRLLCYMVFHIFTESITTFEKLMEASYGPQKLNLQTHNYMY